jgi:anti-sigma regulatory factor (Ser/Thr protein kinase)
MEKIYKTTFFPSNEILSKSLNFVENSCMDSGFDKKRALKLRLSCEEIISALYSIEKNNNPCQVSITDKPDKVVLSIEFFPSGLDLKAFNLPFKPDPLENDNQNDLGLAIASRYVDDFIMEELQFGKIRLNFSVNKSFSPETQNIEPPGEINFFRLVKPNKILITEFSILLNTFYKNNDFHPLFFAPQRLNALFKSGELTAVISVNEKNKVTGGAFCIQTRPEMLEFFGPFVFSSNLKNQTAQDLACHLLEKVARKPYKGVFCTFYEKSYFPEKYFIPAGKDFSQNQEKTAWYFPLSDDYGGEIFIHPDISEYVLNAVKKQDLPRNISILENTDNPEKSSSVFASKISANTKKAVIKIMVTGKDFEQNLDQHINYFKELEIENLSVDIDLSVQSQAKILSVLIKNEFNPSIFLPCGAKGDLLVMSKTLFHKGEKN